MNKKIILLIALLLVVVASVFLITRITSGNAYREQLPELPDLSGLSEPVKEQLTEAWEAASDHPSAENIGRLGMVFHSGGNYDQAKQCYQLAAKRDHSQWIWNYYLGYLNQEMGDSKEAIDNFKAVVQENPKAATVCYYLGKAYRNTGSADLSEEAFLKIASLPNDPSKSQSVRQSYSSLSTIARFELARTYLTTNRVNDAEKLLTEVVRGNESNGPLYRLLGNVYAAKGDLVRSKKFVTRAQDLAEATTVNDTLIDRITLISRSELYLPKQIDEANKSNNPEWAAVLFDHALKYLPENKHVNSKAIRFFLQMNRGEQALHLLDDNLRDFADNFKEMSEISSLLYIKGYYAQALPYFAKTVKLNPESFDIVKNYAHCYWRNDQKDSALWLMNRLYEQYPRNAEVLAYEAELMLKIGEKDKASQFLSKLKQVAPADARYFKFSGVLAEMNGQTAATIPLFETAYKNDPTDLEVSKKLGNYYTQQRQWSKAIAVVRQSLNFHPNDSILLEMLSTLLISCPDPQWQNIGEGLEYAERAYFHVSSSPETLLAAAKNLALGHAMTGNFKEANSYIQTAIQIARSQKVSKAYLDGLNILAGQIKTLGR
jgi:tetratricopeptide (TPR) repeat protein